MELLLLKRKEGVSTCAEKLTVHDDLVHGLLGGIYMPLVFGGLAPLESLIDLYQFPDNGLNEYRCLPFLSGFNKELYNKIEFYKDESFNV